MLRFFYEDIPGLVKAMEIQTYNTNEWRLFKASSIAIAYSTTAKEERATVVLPFNLRYREN